jgi:hypothetical protein
VILGGVVVALALAAGFISLGRWGRRNLGSLIPADASAQRRRKDTRSLRRGARTCFVVGGIFAIFAVVLGVNGISALL